MQLQCKEFYKELLTAPKPATLPQLLQNGFGPPRWSQTQAVIFSMFFTGAPPGFHQTAQVVSLTRSALFLT